MDRKVFAVLWIHTDPSWKQIYNCDLPDDFRVVSPLIDHVDWAAAQVVAEGANAIEARRGRGHWAVIFEQEWADQYLPLLQ